MKIRNIAECFYSKGLRLWSYVVCCSTITNSIHSVRQVDIHPHYHSLPSLHRGCRCGRRGLAWREPMRLSLVLPLARRHPMLSTLYSPPPSSCTKAEVATQTYNTVAAVPRPCGWSLCPPTIPHYVPSSYLWSPRRCGYQVRALHSPMSPQRTPRAKLLGEGS